MIFFAQRVFASPDRQNKLRFSYSKSRQMSIFAIEKQQNKNSICDE